MKICVYAIALNEAKHVERFCKSAADADYILIGDTGSTDNTKQLGVAWGADVVDITIKPWRFDHARNTVLALLPDCDVCVSLDIDEVLTPGWREEIERLWKEDTTRMDYRYDWGKGHIFNATKIHARHGYSWRYICHEMIYPDPRHTEVWARTEKLLIQHLPDDSKSRSNYLDLLLADNLEKPTDPRAQYYLARELGYTYNWAESAEKWEIYLKNPLATWCHERCYAQIKLSICYQNLGNTTQALEAARNATKEAEFIREPWVNLAEITQKQKKFAESFYAATMALSITERCYVYTSDESVWGSRTYDAAAIAAHYTGLNGLALEYGMMAHTLNPEDPRLKSNLEWYR